MLKCSERKLLIIICYYILVTVITLTGFTDLSRKSDLFEQRLNEYFLCELFGHDPNNPCDRTNLEETFSIPLSIISYALHGVLPLVNLIFIIDAKEIKMKYWKAIKKVKYTMSEQK